MFSFPIRDSHTTKKRLLAKGEPLRHQRQLYKYSDRIKSTDSCTFYAIAGKLQQSIDWGHPK
jgi:hypothetical protein